MAPILRGGLPDYAWQICGGDEAMVGPFLRLEPSASICFDTCQLGHPVTLSFPNIMHHQRVIVRKVRIIMSHNEQEKLLQPGVDPSANAYLRC